MLSPPRLIQAVAGKLPRLAVAGQWMHAATQAGVPATGSLWRHSGSGVLKHFLHHLLESVHLAILCVFLLVHTERQTLRCQSWWGHLSIRAGPY